MLSTSVKSNASSSTSAPRVTSSFGHRHDSSGRRASSESLPPGRNRNSIVGNSVSEAGFFDYIFSVHVYSTRKVEVADDTTSRLTECTRQFIFDSRYSSLLRMTTM